MGALLVFLGVPAFSPTIAKHCLGIVAGFGAIFFNKLLNITLKYCLNLPTGYIEPDTGAPTAAVQGFISSHSLWLIIVPTLGGLVSGLTVFLIAPEAEGHGTDVMIEAFHQRGDYIRRRVPFVKILWYGSFQTTPSNKPFTK